MPKKVFALNKTEDLNLSMFNLIMEKNESKTLTKHISCEYIIIQSIIQSKSGIKLNVDASVKTKKTQCVRKRL